MAKSQPAKSPATVKDARAMEAQRRGDVQVLEIPRSGDEPPAGVDDIAESAFRAEAISRGEAVLVTPPVVEGAEESDAHPLPSLDDLVKRIPLGVRGVLDELFRAKFVRVQRVPAGAFKQRPST